MASLAAKRAGRIQHAALHRSALRAGRATIYARAADVDPPLWAETFGEVEFEIFPREYFRDLSLTMPERCRFLIWRQGGRAVAFSYCAVWGTTIFDHDIGLDYSVAHELHLYYVSFRDIIEWALQHGDRSYRGAPFNYDPKMHFRLELEPVDLFVRHRSPVCNFLLHHFAPRFSPVQSDPVLRRHYSATP